jgi:hypothetical protein
VLLRTWVFFCFYLFWGTAKLIKFKHLSCDFSSKALGTWSGFKMKANSEMKRPYGDLTAGMCFVTIFFCFLKKCQNGCGVRWNFKHKRERKSMTVGAVFFHFSIYLLWPIELLWLATKRKINLCWVLWIIPNSTLWTSDSKLFQKIKMGFSETLQQISLCVLKSASPGSLLKK